MKRGMKIWSCWRDIENQKVKNVQQFLKVDLVSFSYKVKIQKTLFSNFLHFAGKYFFLFHNVNSGAFLQKLN